MQDNQEKFMVRTIRLVDDSYVYENTLVVGRPEAVRIAERIGRFETVDHQAVREFLEGKDLPSWKSLDVLADKNIATIYKISDV